MSDKEFTVIRVVMLRGIGKSLFSWAGSLGKYACENHQKQRITESKTSMTG